MGHGAPRGVTKHKKDEQAMTREEKDTALDAVLQPVFERGVDGDKTSLQSVNHLLSLSPIKATSVRSRGKNT